MNQETIQDQWDNNIHLHNKNKNKSAGDSAPELSGETVGESLF